MRLDINENAVVGITGKKLDSPDMYIKGVAIYNIASDTFLCREFVDDDGCSDPNCNDIDFTWKEDMLWLITDDMFSNIVVNIDLRNKGFPINKEIRMGNRAVTDFLWEWIGDCFVVDCHYYRWTVHNRRGIIYGISQLLQGKGYPSSELIPELQEEVFIDVDHIHTTSLLSLRDVG